jgi:hypothetical protein
MTSDGARIIVESRDVGRGGADAPWHRRYLERNIARGRLPGQIRIRVRFRDVAGPWMNYPMVSPNQLREILAGTRWHVARLFDSDDTLSRLSRRPSVEGEANSFRARKTLSLNAKVVRCDIADQVTATRRGSR